MKQESITEQTIDINDIEVGGNAITYIDTRNLEKPLKYMVKNAEMENTEWGARIKYIVVDDYGEYYLSSWNFVSKQKFKATELIGKTITLTPQKDKKPLLTFN